MIRRVFLCLILCTFASDLARAQEDLPEEEIDLFEAELELLAEEDIVIAAAKHKQKIGFSPSAVIVITRKDIDESGATSLLELLRRYPALFVVTINPSQSLVFARGSYRVLLILDGREINMELFPQPFYEIIPVGIHHIDRIEIVLGPNSALYGANAVSAVINIVTRKPSTDFHTDLSLAMGQNGNTLLEGMLEGGSGSWAFQGSFGVDREHSWMDRTQVPRDIIHANSKARLAFDDGALALDGGLVAGSVLLFADGIGYVSIFDVLFTHAKADFELGDLKARVYWSHMEASTDIDLRLTHPDMGITLGTIPIVDFSGDVAHVDAQYDLELFKNNLLIVGADFWYTVYRSDQAVNPEMSEIRTGVFLHDEHRFGEWLHLTAGARFDWNSQTDAAISPQLALVFNPAGEHYIRLSGGTAFRKPVLLESSINFKIDAEPGFENDMQKLFEDIGISNPNLENEILTTVELGYLGFLLDKALRISANVYFGNNRQAIELTVHFEFKEFMQIDFEKTSLGYMNQRTQENVIGASLSIEGDLIDELTLFLRGEYRRDWLVQVDGEWSHLTSHHRAIAGGVLHLPIGLTASLAAAYVGAFDDTVPNPRSILAPGTWTAVPARTYLMANLSYHLELGPARLILGLSVFNPFGARFREKLGTTAPDGTNYGGEFLAPRAMLTARLVY